MSLISADNTRRLKTLVRNVVEAQRSSEDVPVLALEDLQSWTGRILPTVEDRRVRGFLKRCRQGDVVFGKLRPYLAKAATIRRDVTVVGEFLVLRPGTEVRAEFLEYTLRSAPFIDQVSALTAGAKMPRVEWLTLGTVPIRTPERAEQDLVVRFLRHAELHIAQAITAKRNLVTLLDERRRVLSQEFVTRGLVQPGAAQLSGIEWLGNVPAHWEIRPAKRLYREVNDRSEHGEEQLLSVSHLTGVTPRAVKNVTMFMAASYAGHKLCRPGDLVINTMWAWMGALGVAAESGIVSPSYGVYRPLLDSPLEPAYADLLLRTRPYVDEYTCRSTGIRASRLRLYPERFLTIPVVCPPQAEQRQIVARVANTTRDLEAAIDSALREIELLEEYRTRLISDVVTGHRDVRAEAAALPEVDPEELDAVLSAASGDEHDGGNVEE